MIENPKPEPVVNDVEISEVKLRTPLDVMKYCQVRLLTLCAIEQEPNDKRRAEMMSLWERGKVAIGKVVPYVRHPRPFSELLLKNAIHHSKKLVFWFTKRNPEENKEK